VAGGVWETGCGEAHVFFVDGPTENKCRFCCYCGKPLRAVRLSVCTVCCCAFSPDKEGQAECDPLGCPGREDAEIRSEP
jgi:hypothetical protein